MPKITIIMPVYNAENYLEKCLNSIIKQTITDIEIICVNDCSTDNSNQILNNFKSNDSRIKILNHTVNKGVSEARNTGLNAAAGDYIYFIDSDDWIDENYLETMVNMLEEKKADIIINTNVITEKESFSAPYMHPGHKNIVMDNFIPQNKAIENLMCNVWNRIIKRSDIKKYHLTFPKGYSFAEDLYYHYISLAHTNKIYAMKGSAYHYNSLGSGISQIASQKDIDSIKIFEKIYDYYMENNLLENGIKIYSVMPFYNINNADKYTVFKNYFVKIEKYLFSHSTLYNELDLFFAKNILSTADYEDYRSKFAPNVSISFLRRKK